MTSDRPSRSPSHPPSRPVWRPPTSPVAAIALALLVALLAGSTPAWAQAAATAEAPPTLTLDQLFDRESWGAQPSSLTWSPDGGSLAYLFNDGDGMALWALSPVAAGTTPRKVLSRLATSEAADAIGEAGSEAAAENGREDDDEGGSGGGLSRTTEFSWSPDGSTLLVTDEGDLWTVPAASGAATRLTDTEAKETAATWSPDGSQIAFIRDYDLHVLPAGGGEARALTRDGEENEILNGVTDWVYWEEIWGRDATGFWWSPDGTKIAYYRFDEAPVATYPIVDFTVVPYPAVKPQKYPKAGSDNPRVQLGVMDVARGAESTVWLDTSGDEEATEESAEETYLARLHWHPLGDKVAVHRLSREQTDLDLLLCDPASGECSTLLNEHHDTWVNLEDDFAFLADGRFVWGSARTGWRHLYLYEADGSLIRPLTSGEWAVTSLDAVDEKHNRVIFTSFPPGPLGAKDRRVAAVSLDAPDGGAPTMTPLTEGDGWHGTTVAADGRWVHTWSDADTPPQQVIRGADGGEIAQLPSRPPAFDVSTLPAYRFFEIEGADGTSLPAMTLEPGRLPASGPSPGDGTQGTHPGLMYHYGGPGSQVVSNAWGRRSLWQKMMAQRGYAVLAVDNPASTYFGKRGEDRQHRRFGPLNLAAQQAGAAWLAAQPGVDGERIGLWGWSGGGTNTLYCLFNSPGTWAAGMAGAPVTDWRLYDTIWTERYLDHPDDNPEGYRLSSPITHVDGLTDPLLVVHGTADDNVHPQNTLALIAKLVAAGKPFDEAVYPGQKHGFRGKSEEHFYRRMTEWFDRTLSLDQAQPLENTL